MDLDVFPFQLANVADISQVAGEDHDCERALFVIETEIKIGGSCGSLFDMQHFAFHTTGLADMLGGVPESKALRGAR
jgi:hypothetical protein